MLLHLQSVNTYYGKVQALHGASLHVDEGEIVTLIGANGAGKSTLLMSICGDPRPSSGSITFDGAELMGLETPAIIHKGIAIAPEGRRVFARLTVEENLSYAAELKGLNDVAYVRFAAVYRKFTDVGTFMNELKKLVDEKM